MNENSSAHDMTEELGGGLSGKVRGVAEAFGKWWLRGGTSPEGAAAAQSLDEGWVREELRAREPAWRPEQEPSEGLEGRVPEEWENGVIRGTRRMPGSEPSGTPSIGEGGPGPLQEGGSRCVPGRTVSRREEEVRNSFRVVSREVRTPEAGGARPSLSLP